MLKLETFTDLPISNNSKLQIILPTLTSARGDQQIRKWNMELLDFWENAFSNIQDAFVGIFDNYHPY